MWAFCYKNTNKIKVSSLLWTKTHPVNRRELESFNKLNGSAFEYVRNDLVHSVSYAKELFSGFFFLIHKDNFRKPFSDFTFNWIKLMSCQYEAFSNGVRPDVHIARYIVSGFNNFCIAHLSIIFEKIINL